jgi:hypothetical protein
MEILKFLISEETGAVRIAQAEDVKARFERNWAWLEAHAKEVYSHRGKYICVSGEELFVGDSVEELINQAKAKHPDDTGIISRILPRETGDRIGNRIPSVWIKRSTNSDGSPGKCQEPKAPKYVVSELNDPVEIALANERARKFKQNCDWLNTNAKEVYSHRGKYVCIAGQQLFIGDDVKEVVARARTAHPDDDAPFVQFVPNERSEAIYAF